MTPHSSTLAWEISWMEEPGRLQSMGHKESDMTEWLHFHFSLSCTGEGNGNPLQCSCLENSRDGGAWWVAVYGVAQSQTRLTQLRSSSSSRQRKQEAPKPCSSVASDVFQLLPKEATVERASEQSRCRRRWGWKEWEVLEESGIHSVTRVVTRFLRPLPGTHRPSRSHCSDVQEGWCSCGFGWTLRFSDELDLQLLIRGKPGIIDSVKYSFWGDMPRWCLQEQWEQKLA